MPDMKKPYGEAQPGVKGTNPGVSDAVKVAKTTVAFARAKAVKEGIKEQRKWAGRSIAAVQKDNDAARARFDAAGVAVNKTSGTYLKPSSDSRPEAREYRAADANLGKQFRRFEDITQLAAGKKQWYNSFSSKPSIAKYGKKK